MVEMLRTENRIKFYLIVISMVCLEGCASLLPFGSDDTAEQTLTGDDAATPKKIKKNREFNTPKPTATLEEVELKNAKLWARVDQLEDAVQQQKERLRVVEKGVMLGLVPEELKTQHQQQKKPAKSQIADELAQRMSQKAAPPPVKIVTPLAPTADDQLYKKRLSAALENFRSGRYGVAIADFSEIAKSYPDKVGDGSHKYWIAMCWAHLKEYDSARQNFSSFLQDHPSNPWVPRAKLELARVEVKLGFRDTAMGRLRQIIETHPYEDAAEMAKMEISNMEKAL